MQGKKVETNQDNECNSRKTRSSIDNIVFIGMPGCGKTSFGKLAAEATGLTFIDMDEYIEKKHGSTVSELFTKGETYFRELEARAVQELSFMKGILISTGGGVVKSAVNMDRLCANGWVFFINRPLEQIVGDIDISGRPLLKNNASVLENLYHERYELYKRYCDVEILNDQEFEQVLEEIINRIREKMDMQR